jgi:hypothetical protein
MAINPAMIRIDPETALAAWTTLSTTKSDQEIPRTQTKGGARPLSWVGLSALAQPRLTKDGQPYLEARMKAAAFGRDDRPGHPRHAGRTPLPVVTPANFRSPQDRCLSLYSILHTQYSRVFRSPLAAPFEFCLSPCPPVNLSTGQLTLLLINRASGPRGL